jgi:DMSO reductase family type II enzyme chaperone
MTTEFLMVVAESIGARELLESRLSAYRFLLAALDKPTPEQHAWLRSPPFREALELVCAEFALPCPDGESAPEDYGEFESRYLACFEVGGPAPAVALQASVYNRREPIPAIIHEHVLFYKRFALHLPDDDIEPADHLLNELAFLIHLDELLLTRKVEQESILLARRDFLRRQVTRWLEKAAGEATDRALPAAYCALLAVLAKASQQDLELSEHALNQPTEKNP